MAKTKSSAKTSKTAAPKRAAPKAAAKPAPKAASQSTSRAAPKSTAPAAAKAQPVASPKDTKLEWSAAIKKALQEKNEQPNWPGSGDAWKRKNKV